MTKTLKGLCSLSIDLQEKIKSYFKHKDRHVQSLTHNLFYRRVFKNKLSVEEALEILEKKINGDNSTTAHRFLITIRDLDVEYSQESLYDFIVNKLLRITILRTEESKKRVELNKEVESFIACFEDSNDKFNCKHIHLGLWLNHKSNIAQSDFYGIVPNINTIQIERMEHEFESVRYCIKGFMCQGKWKKVVAFSKTKSISDISIGSRKLNSNSLLRTLVKGTVKTRKTQILENLGIIFDISNEFDPEAILLASGNSLITHVEEIYRAYQGWKTTVEKAQITDVSLKLKEKGISFEKFFDGLKKIYNKAYFISEDCDTHPLEMTREILEIFFTSLWYLNNRPHKSKNLLLWSNVANVGKTTSAIKLESVLFPIYHTSLNSNNLVGLHDGILAIVDNQLTFSKILNNDVQKAQILDGSEGPTYTKTCVEGVIRKQTKEFNKKFGHVSLSTNPLWFLQSNDDCSDQVFHHYAHKKARAEFFAKTADISQEIKLLKEICDDLSFSSQEEQNIRLQYKQRLKELQELRLKMLNEVNVSAQEIFERETSTWKARFHFQCVDDEAFFELHKTKCGCKGIDIFKGKKEEYNINYGKLIFRRVINIFSIWIKENLWYEKVFNNEEDLLRAVYDIDSK